MLFLSPQSSVATWDRPNCWEVTLEVEATLAMVNSKKGIKHWMRSVHLSCLQQNIFQFDININISWLLEGVRDFQTLVGVGSGAESGARAGAESGIGAGAGAESGEGAESGAGVLLEIGE